LLKGVYPPIFHPLSRYGLYVLRFYKNCSWRYVIIDDRIPCKKKGVGEYDYIFSHTSNKFSLFLQLIEKAYAKLHLCYEALQTGFLKDAI